MAKHNPSKLPSVTSHVRHSAWFVVGRRLCPDTGQTFPCRSHERQILTTGGTAVSRAINRVNSASRYFYQYVAFLNHRHLCMRWHRTAGETGAQYELWLKLESLVSQTGVLEPANSPMCETSQAHVHDNILQGAAAPCIFTVSHLS